MKAGVQRAKAGADAQHFDEALKGEVLKWVRQGRSSVATAEGLTVYADSITSALPVIRQQSGQVPKGASKLAQANFRGVR
jgi:hypothetical protein